MREAQIYKNLEDKKVKCELCYYECLINSGGTGVCGVRYNNDGVLLSLVYGKVIAKNIDPVEKKPLFHFMPGTRTYSIGTVGCNLHCSNCQNYSISQTAKTSQKQNIPDVPGKDMTAEQVVREALDNNCPSISYTYNEPTVFFEFALDCMKLAKENGLKNIWVSNGYMSDKCLDEIIPYLDAINVDLKFFTDKNYIKVCGAKLEPILKNIQKIKKAGVWVELTTLLIHGYNDSIEELKNIAEFIANKLDVFTPWHILRFFPNYKLTDVMPTEKEKLIEAYDIGKKTGLKYVYIGNVLDSCRSGTYCPKNHLVIERKGVCVQRLDKDGKCPECGEEIIIVE
ncbi:MAG: AmmeMemoRadiSam system radical SAM enzyme [bacterium]